MNETNWIVENFWPLSIALLTFLKALGNLLPSEKPREVFAILDKIVNALVPDNIKTPEE